MASRNLPLPRERSRRKTVSRKRRRPTHDTKTNVKAQRKRRHASSTRDDADASSTSPHKRRQEDHEASPGSMGYSDCYRPDPGDHYRPRGSSRGLTGHYNSREHQDSSPYAREHSTTQQSSPRDSPTKNRSTTSRREPFVLAFPAHVDRYIPSPLPSPVPSRDNVVRTRRCAWAENLAGEGGAGRVDGGSAWLEGGTMEDTNIPFSDRTSAGPEWEAAAGGSSAAGDSPRSRRDMMMKLTENVLAERRWDWLVIEDMPILDDEV